MNYSLPELKINTDILQKFLQSNALLYCVVLLFVLRIATVSLSINFPHNMFFADITRSSLENFVNQTRQSVGLKPLAENEKLDQAAQMKAQNMVQDQYFNHTSPSGVSPWFWFQQAGYNYKYAGENLAIGFYESQEVYNAWLNSPEHRANIVNNNYTEVGTAVLGGFGSNNSIVVVQEFGSQQPVKPVAPQSQPKPTPKPVPTPTSTTKITEPVATTGDNSINNSEEVLSQTTQAQSFLEVPSGNAVNSLSSKILNSVLYNYDGLLQNMIFGVSIVIIGILLTLIFLNFNFNFKKELVFRAVLIVVLLSVATLVNKEIIVSLIPHQILI